MTFQVVLKTVFKARDACFPAYLPFNKLHHQRENFT